MILARAVAFLFVGWLVVVHPNAAAEASAEPDPMVTQALSPAQDSSGLNQNGVSFGVYDPHGAFEGDRNVAIEHIFVFWQALDMERFRQSLRYAERQHRMLLITIEPYTRAENWRDQGEHLFSDILAGEFDPEISRICRELNVFQGDVLVRWGHEMEDPDGRYPWARHDNTGYKAAYRYVVEECRRHVPRATFVWSPKGQRNIAEYYPGDEHVDIVGLSLWGLQKYDEHYRGGARNFANTFWEKYERVAVFGKPVMIGELGVSGDSSYRQQWFDSMFREIAVASTFPKLQAVVYFNDKEPWHWPLGLGSPDWRINAGWFSSAKKSAQQR